MIHCTLNLHHDCYLLFAVEGASNVGEKPGTIQAVVGEVAKIPCELTPGRAKATQAFYFAHISRLTALSRKWCLRKINRIPSSESTRTK